MLHLSNNADSELEELEFLIKFGAPRELVGADNITSLHYTVRSARTKMQSSFCGMVCAWTSHCTGELGLAVLKLGIIYRSQTLQNPALSLEAGGGLTPLRCAALVGQDEMIAFLHKEAIVNALSDYGETPLQLALATTLGGTRYGDHWTSMRWRAEVILDIIDMTDDEEFDEAQRGVLARWNAVLDARLPDSKTDININNNG